MMSFLGLNGGIPGIFRWLGCVVCNLIYFLISRLFQLFMVVSQLNILSDEKIGPIYQRVTLILTIVMVFYITFEFVKYVVEPETMTDKEKGVGNIVKRMIIAIVLIAFVPRIFTMAYDLQNRLIKNQVFSKIILGETNINYETFGSAFSADMLGVFYGVDEKYCSGSNYDSACQTAEAHVKANLEQLRTGNEVTIQPGLNDTKEMTVGGIKEEVFPVKFDGIMAIVVGCVILYLVILYTIDIGTRYAQLIFLQIMSPIAILGYISPKKDNIFSKWLKQCTTTYLDLFIRLTIIYFILLIIDILSDSFTSGTLFAGVEGTTGYEALAYIALIMGLLVFAGKAPKMIGELLPVGSGAAGIGYGLKAGDRFTPTINGVKRTFNAGRRTAGGVAGAAHGLYKGFKDGKKQKAWSALKAGFQGLRAGAGKGGGIRKGLDAARGSVQKDIDTADKGGTPLGADLLGGHYADIAKQQDRVIEEYKVAKTIKDQMFAQVDEIASIKSIKKSWDAAKARGDDATAKALEKTYKSACQSARREIVANGGKITDANGQPIVIKYDEFAADANGNPIKTGNQLSFGLESGDQKFAEALTHITKEERRKTEGTALDKLEITIGKDANGNPIKKEISKLSETEFAEFMHEIADVAGTAEVKAKDKKYEEAHANAQASGKSGK